MTSLNWKFRYYNHLQSFKNSYYPEYYWNLTPIINWKIKDPPQQTVYTVSVIYA